MLKKEMMKSVVSEKAYIGIFVEKGFNYGAFFKK